MKPGTNLQSVHLLRRRWKPRKEAILRQHKDDPTCIRLHRCFSWMQRCEQCGEGQDPDVELICLWIAFNSLYGRWDVTRREPVPDRISWQQHLTRVVQLDGTGYVGTMLGESRELVVSILDDEHLSSYFWEDPSDERAGKSRKAKYDARTWYLQGKWSMLLERVVERVYLLRCQLVHGAATCQSRLNRQSLAACVRMMRQVLNAVLLVMIDHGEGEDWGQMCYPPLGGTSA